MRLFPVALIVLLAWAALAFGGSPTWAAASALVLGVATGILGFLERASVARHPAPTSRFPHRSVAFALGLVLLTVGLQVLPIPNSVIASISPARNAVDYEQLLAGADRRDPTLVDRPQGASKPIAIVSSRTQIGLAGLAGLALLLLGTCRGLSTVGTRGVTHAILVLGVAVTLLGLYQLTATTTTLYGWYVPLFGDGHSAPFINPNHHAGWLVMVMSLSIGAFAGEAARGMRGVAPHWRDRIVWLSSKEASVALLLLFASAMMAAGILATRARSGAATMVLALGIVAWWSGHRQPTRLGKVATAAGLIVVALAVLAFNGQAVLQEIAETEGLGPRLAIWQDSMRIARDFWLTGTGFNTYGTAMLHYQTVRDGFRYVEAHNEYLQLAAEGGLLVGIPFLVLAIVLVAEIRRRFRAKADDTRTYWIRVGAVTGLIAIALQSIGDFTLQMPGGAVMFTTLLAIAIHHPPTFAKATVGKPTYAKATAGKPPRPTRDRHDS